MVSFSAVKWLIQLIEQERANMGFFHLLDPRWGGKKTENRKNNFQCLPSIYSAEKKLSNFNPFTCIDRWTHSLNLCEFFYKTHKFFPLGYAQTPEKNAQVQVKSSKSLNSEESPTNSDWKKKEGILTI